MVREPRPSRWLERKRSSRPNALHALAAVALLVSIVSGLAPLPGAVQPEPVAAHHTNVRLPVPSGEVWNISQGYNTSPAQGGSHYSCDPSTLKDQPSQSVSCSQYWQYKYSLDLVAASGTTAGRTVVSPVSGVIRWIDESYGGMSIDLGDGYAYAFFHVALSPSLTEGQALTQGQYVGTVATAGNGGNGGFPHIHVNLWRTTDGGNWSRIPEPFTGDHAIDSVDLPALGDSQRNQHQGRTLTSSNVVSTSSEQPPSYPILASPPHGTTYNEGTKIATLSWNPVNGATGYQVVINDGAIVSPWVTGTSWTTGTLGLGQYAWQVKSRNSAGESALSPKWVFWVEPAGSGTPTPGTTPGTLSMNLSATSGAPGLSATASGSGMANGESVELFWDTTSGTKLATATANSSGNWSAGVQIPDATGGSHAIIAKGKTSGKSTQAAFTVNPALIRTPYQGPAGTRIAVTVKGFGASETVGVTFYHNSSSTVSLGSTTTNANGTGTLSVTLPEATTGWHDYKGTGQTSGKTAWGALYVQPSVTLSSTQGNTGSSVTAKVTGFPGSQSITVAWNKSGSSAGTQLCSATTSSVGTYSCTFTVPQAAAGAYPITATTNDGTTASANYGIAGAAAITLTPAQGAVGAPFQISIGGFQAGETVRLTIDGSSTAWQDAKVDSTGSTLVKSTIPYLTQGAHTIGAHGLTSGKTASGTVTVVPSMELSPSGGAANASVSAFVRGMKPNQSISIRFNATSSTTGTGVCSGTTGSDGAYTCTFRVPSVSGGNTYPVYAGSGGQSATANFAVTSSGVINGGAVLGIGTYQITATQEGLVGGTTSNGHVIVPNDHFVSLPACTPSNCDWLSGGSTSPTLGYITDCGSSCYVRVTNPETGACRVEPIWDTGPWFTNDNWWEPTERRNLNNLSTTVNVLAQGYTGADAAKDGLDVGYGISAGSGWGISNKGYEVGNRAAIDIADGTWKDIGLPDGAGARTVVVSMLWQTGEDIATARQSCLGTSSTGDPRITIDPTSGQVGSTVTVTGSNYASGERVDIFWDSTSSGSPVQSVTASGSGAFTATVTIPDATAGNHLIVGKGATSGSKPSRTFTILPKTSILIDPLQGPAGTTVTVNGQGFSPGEKVTLYWDSTGSTGTTLGTATASSTGAFTSTVTVPTDSIEKHLIVGRGNTSGFKASRSFTLQQVVINGSIMIDPLTGPAGTSVTVTGSGFAPSEQVAIYWDSTGSSGIVLGTATANSSGGFSTEVTVPDASDGKHLIVGLGKTSREKASRSFAVAEVPAAKLGIVIDPTSGRTATSVAVTGTGFASGERVDIYWDSTGSTGVIIGGATASTAGSISTTVTVPHDTGGRHLIVGRGSRSGSKASRSFTIMPSISVSATSVSPGDTVRVTLRGYQPGEPVTLFWDTTTGPALTTLTANGTGSAAGSFVAPASVNGQHQLLASGSVTAGQVTAAFTLSGGSTAAATATFATSSASPGDRVGLNIGNFWSGERIEIYWDDRTSPTSSTQTGFDGSAALTVTVPTLPGGSHTVTVKGVTSGKSATTTITLAPVLILTPPIGAEGARIVADVKGWTSGATVTIYFNRSGSSGGTAVCTATGRSSGTASCSFLVPAGFSVGSDVPVTASGSAGTASATLRITNDPVGFAPAAEATATPEATATASATPGDAATPAPESSETPVGTAEATGTATETPTETATVEPTPTPTEVVTDTPAAEETEAPAEGATEAPAAVATEAPTEAPIEVATEEPTPEPTVAPEPRALTVYAASDAVVYAARPDEQPSPELTGLLTAGGTDGAMAYITFSVEGIGTGTVTNAQLVLTGGGEPAAGDVIGVIPELWVDEASATFNSLPTQGISAATDGAGNPVYLPVVGSGQEVWLDVTGTIYGDGVITFVVTGSPDTIATLLSRESGIAPRLEMTVQD